MPVPSVSLLDPEEVADRFPALRTDHLAVGAVAENAGYVETDAFVTAMIEATQGAGVTLRTDCPVSMTADGNVSTPAGTDAPESVVLAAGPYTRALAAAAGQELAVGTYRVQALQTGPVAADPPVLYDASDRFYLRRAGDGVSVSPRRSWAGLCTATPDRDPLVGQLADGLFVATGWHGHGFMRAPAIGERLAKQVCGGDGIAHFDPTRFDGDEAIALPAGTVD